MQRYEIESVFDGDCPLLRVDESDDGDWVYFTDLPPSNPWLDTPTEPGWYWYRHGEEEPVINEVIVVDVWRRTSPPDMPIDGKYFPELQYVYGCNQIGLISQSCDMRVGLWQRVIGPSEIPKQKQPQ